MWGKNSLGPGVQIPIPPGYGIGIATGSRSGIVGIDLDRKNGVDGLGALQHLATSLGQEVPETLTVLTPTKGYHLYYAYSGDDLYNSASVLGPGIDVRAEGGFLVAPPSPHRVGGNYQWLDPTCPIAPLPAWLIDILRNPPKQPRKITRAKLEKLAAKWKRSKSPNRQERGEILLQICRGESFALPGERDTTLFQIASDLAREWPDADPGSIGELFTASLDLMAREAPGAPTSKDVEDKFTRAVENGAGVSNAPEIRISTDITRMVDQAEQALARVGELYRRGNTIVREVADAKPPPELIREVGTPVIQIVPEAAVREKLSQGARWVTAEDTQTLPPPWVVESLLARSTWPELPPLEHIIETPILRKSGTILDRVGYDSSTGILYRPKVSYPNIPDAPTMHDVHRSIAIIEDIICDFRFVTIEHKAGFYAALLTPLARTMFEGACPLFLFDASTPGAGKGKLAKIAAIIGTGRFPSLAQFPREEEERRKAITTYALEGDRIVCFDNVTGLLGGNALCTALTEPVWTDRVLGSTKRWSGPMSIVFYATSNNAQIGADMDRRVVHIRLDPGVEDPEKRTGFRYPDVITETRRVQPLLTAAALTILRGYVAASRPPQHLEAWGSYEGWASFILGAMRWAGLPDIGVAREGLADKDPQAEYQHAFVHGWHELCATKRIPGRGPGLTVAEAMSTIYPPKVWERPFPKMAEAIESVLRLPKQEQPTAIKLGQVLRSMEGRYFGGRKIVSVGSTRDKVKIWGTAQ